MLADLRTHYDFAMHGVSLSIGSVEPLNVEYLNDLKKLASYLDVAIISDHLCYTGIHGKNTHDLLPIPYTQEALSHIIPRINKVQDYLGRKILLENPSSYVEFKNSTISEEEFLSELCRKTGCGILLDINNVYISSFNHGSDPKSYLQHIKSELIGQYHLAGHTNKVSHLIDTHNQKISVYTCTAIHSVRHYD